MSDEHSTQPSSYDEIIAALQSMHPPEDVAVQLKKDLRPVLNKLGMDLKSIPLDDETLQKVLTAAFRQSSFDAAIHSTPHSNSEENIHLGSVQVGKSPNRYQVFVVYRERKINVHFSRVPENGNFRE